MNIEVNACDARGWFGYKATVKPSTIQKAHTIPKEHKMEFWAEFFGDDRFIEAHVLIWHEV